MPREKIDWARLLFITATLSIVFSVIGHYFVTKYSSVIADKHDRAVLIAHSIELNIDARLTALTFLACDPDINSLEPAKMRNALVRAMKKFGFFNVVVFDCQGNFIAEANPDFHIGHVYDSESFNKVIRSRQPAISNRIVYSGLDNAYVSFRVPLLDDNNQVKAVLVAGMPIVHIAEMINQLTDPILLRNDGEYVFIIDGNLNYIVHPRLKEIYPEEHVMGRTRGIFPDSTNNAKINELYTSINIAQANWRVVVATPMQIVYLEILKKSISQLTIIVLLLLVIVLCYLVLKQRRAEKLAIENLQFERLNCASQMAATVAHEVRNPLTSIKGFVQLIMRKADCPPPINYLEIIVSEIDRIESLINEFQALAKPIKSAEFVPLELAKIVQSVVLLMEGQALNKKVRLNFEDQLDYKWIKAYYVMGDQSQLKQVFINIVRNAIEAVDENGNIDIFLSRQGVNLAVVVKDNGSGMTKEVLAKLGTPFYTTKPKGTGLGLSVCFNIISNHGGKIEVTSEVGKGTKFTILLPL